MNIQDIRKANLRAWTQIHGVPGREKSYLSQILSGTAIGERAARRLELGYRMGFSACGYHLEEFEVRSLYFSEEAGFSDNILGDHAPFALLSARNAKYFVELVGTIEKSARFELFKFLNVSLSQLGEQKRTNDSAHRSRTIDRLRAVFFCLPS